MAIYRSIQMSFWTDVKVAEDFTPEDKYFYLYLLTNPKTNLSGCYEFSIRQASIDTGYTKETVSKLMERFEKVLGVILYSKENKEVLILHWYKYNWTASEKFKAALKKHIESVKTPAFKQYLVDLYSGKDTVSIPYQYGMDTPVTVTDTVTVSDTVTDKSKKKKYGEYKHVSLTDEEYDRLVKDYGEQAVISGIKNVDEYCQEHGKTYKDYNLTLRKWGIKSPKLAKPKEEKPPEVEKVNLEWERSFYPDDEEWEKHLKELEEEGRV